MLTALADTILACSTAFLQANTSLSAHDSLQNVGTVLSDRPWKTLDFIETPDCATVVVDETWLQPLAFPIARSRMKASLVVSTEMNELLLAYVLKSNKNLNFDAHIVSSRDSFQKGKIFSAPLRKCDYVHHLQLFVRLESFVNKHQG